MSEVGLGVSTQLVTKKIKDANPNVTGVKEDRGIGTTVDNPTEHEKLKADAFVGSSGEAVVVTQEQIDTAWQEAVTEHNNVVPDAKTIEIGGVSNNGEQEQFSLGGSGNQEVDTLSTGEQRSALTEAVNTEANNLEELANGDLRQLNNGEVGPNGIKLLDNTEGDLANLDTQRAAMHKRQEEIRKALTDNTGVLNAEQKAQLEAEQVTLNGAMETIDNVPKTFQAQNGANIKITSGSNIVSIDQSSINSTESLEGYEGFFDHENDSPTVSDAYAAFQEQMQEATGQDFTLKDNQNIVMYRDGEEVKFLLVESAMNQDNRETVISKPITASKRDDGTTTISTDNIAPTKDDQQTVTGASIEGYKFTNNNNQPATDNGSGGEVVTISLVEDGNVNESWLNLTVRNPPPSTRPEGIPEGATEVEGQNILGAPVYMETEELALDSLEDLMENEEVYMGTEELALYSGAPQPGTISKNYYSFTLTRAQLEGLKNNPYLGYFDNGWLQDGLKLTNDGNSTGRRDIITRNNDNAYTLKVSQETLDRLLAATVDNSNE